MNVIAQLDIHFQLSAERNLIILIIFVATAVFIDTVFFLSIHLDELLA